VVVAAVVLVVLVVVVVLGMLVMVEVEGGLPRRCSNKSLPKLQQQQQQ
jgi:hypothetical protein